MLPAVRRAEEFEKRVQHDSGLGQPQNGKPLGQRREKGGGPSYEPGTPGHRREIVEIAFMGYAGMKREDAERKYDQQLRQWYAEQGIEPPPGAFPSKKKKRKRKK